MKKRILLILACALMALLVLLPGPASVSGRAEALSATVTLSPDPVEVEQTITATVDVRGGQAPYRFYYWWRLVEATCESCAQIDMDSGSPQSQYRVRAGIAVEVEVIIHDSVGAVLELDPVRAVIQGDTDAPLSAEAKLSAGSVAVGQTQTVTVAAQGGTPPYTYSFYPKVYDDVQEEEMSLSDSFIAYTLSSQHTFSLPFGTQGYVTIEVEDAKERSLRLKTERFEITGDESQPMAVFSSVTPYNVQAGGEATVNVEVTGGKAPYRYGFHWCVYDEAGERQFLPTDAFSSVSPRHTKTIPYGVKGYVLTHVHDAAGRYLPSYAHFRVEGDISVPPSLEVPELSAREVRAGDSLTVTARAQGGTGIYEYGYVWYIQWEEGGEYLETRNSGYTEETIDSFRLPGGVSGYVDVYIRDTANRRAWLRSPVFQIKEGTTEPLDAWIWLDQDRGSPGQTLTAEARVSGGIPPYSYRFIWMIDEGLNSWEDSADVTQLPGPWGEQAGNTSSFQLPTYGLKGSVGLVVRDAAGVWADSSRRFYIDGHSAPNPLQGRVYLSDNTVQCGSPITFFVEADGGTPPYGYEYQWRIQDGPGGPEYLYRQVSDQPSLTVTPRIWQRGELRCAGV